VPSPRERFLAFRRSLPRTPQLHRQTVRVRGLRFAVFTTPPVTGDEPPLACVNGGLLYDHTLLWPALSPLAARRQLVFYDQRGRGESEPPADPSAARIEDDAADVGALRRALGLRRWDLLGHSWGGAVAALGATEDHAGTRRLVLVDAVGPTSAWMPALRAAGLERSNPQDRAVLERLDDTALAVPDPAMHEAHARAIYRAWFANRELAELFRPPRSDSLTGAAIAARLRREGYDWRPILRALPSPTLVFHGTEDALPTGVAEELVRLLPQARLTLIPGSGHMPFWEQPEAFFPAVESFLLARTLGHPPA
jgi:proline iminopeptidase